ncbi:hypothetical protein LTR99_002397 [Exophiala xenobiotica]|uniref:Inner kinetochore subunit AME1 domain-containing protein n=1 Tax=Vermiconidia calcicola TaxID=1690605 RepID=A0AAV9QHT6_9PEZI|nr:hypothetical protein LTR99_002397 [Exophiala xenobiotica]KAK5434034.1 hypothetical protein LTR34_003546 [Exophiala xenobiotica]KAK5541530.1 hypothetical protein LTR23_005852 [Chaetothyriales sp. CCFEE 6169]KAK5542266.1 hypothetical protein LTR25_002151 [Vermiconidia calcicola]
MALDNRQDRALMRQRGAGARNVAKADFGFDFGFNIARQDRQQMRQRGAASRQIESADFGLSFPSSARSRRSTTTTPQARRRTSSRPSRTPARRSREHSIARSIRQTSLRPEEQHGIASEQSERSTKRRRLSNTAATPSQELGLATPTLRSTRSATRKKTRSSIFTIAEDGEAQEPRQVQIEALVTPRPLDDSPLFVQQDSFGKENSAPGNVTSAKAQGSNDTRSTRRRTRSSLILDEEEHTARTAADANGGDSASIERADEAVRSIEAPESTAVVEHAESGASSQDAKQGNIGFSGAAESSLALGESFEASTRQEHPLKPSKARKSTQGSHREVSEDDINESVLLPKKGRRKRKSVNLGRRKRRSSTSERANTRERSFANDVSSKTPSSVPQSVPASSMEPEVVGKHRRKRLGPASGHATPDSHRNRSPLEAEEEEDQTYSPGTSPEPETPAVTKKSGRNERRRSAQAGERRVSQTKKPKATFPILTHRLTNVPRLPTIHEEELEEQSDDERDRAVTLATDRGRPNAVDVLAQICRETIANMIERIVDTDQPLGRAAMKNKRSALEVFGHDLDDELFEMSEAVENRIDLEAGVRKSKREKAALQAEWIEIRKERERIALRCDAVRRNNWEHEAEVRQKWQLSEAARRAELELDRAEPVEQERTEYLLRCVTDELSSASAHGGLLERIKSFNAHLETMARCL